MTDELTAKLKSNFPEITAGIQQFSCHDGWYGLIWNVLSLIKEWLEYPPLYQENGEWVNRPPFTLRLKEVGEKHSSLQIYYTGENVPPEIKTLMEITQHMSMQVCEFCGTTKSVGEIWRGWTVTTCKPCAVANNRDLQYWQAHADW